MGDQFALIWVSGPESIDSLLHYLTRARASARPAGDGFIEARFPYPLDDHALLELRFALTAWQLDHDDTTILYGITADRQPRRYRRRTPLLLRLRRLLPAKRPRPPAPLNLARRPAHGERGRPTP